MGDNSIFDPASRLHLNAADSVIFIGHTMPMHGRGKRAFATYCVVHRGNGTAYTHVYLVPVQAGIRGEVFLAKFIEGERVSEALGWVGRNLAVVTDGGARRAA